MLFAGGTVFAFGVCFFWPTMLGYVAETFPKTGALGLAIMGGAGMLSVSPTWLLTGEGESPGNALNETEMMHIRATVERMREQVLTVADELEQLEARLDSYECYND